MAIGAAEGPDREPIPGAQGPPHAAAEARREQEAAPAEDHGDVEAAGHGEVGDTALLGGWQGADVVAGEPRGNAVPGDAEVTPARGDDEPAKGLDRGAAPGVADGAVGGDEALGHQRTAGGHPVGHVAGAAGVLHPRGPDDGDELEVGAHAGSKRTRSPGRSVAPTRGSKASKSSAVATRFQPPGEAAG